MNSVFLDTSYAVALSAQTDENNQRAEELAEQFEAEGTQFVTTQAILLEIGNALAKVRYRQAAVSSRSTPLRRVWFRSDAALPPWQCGKASPYRRDASQFEALPPLVATEAQPL